MAAASKTMQLLTYRAHTINRISETREDAHPGHLLNNEAKMQPSPHTFPFTRYSCIVKERFLDLDLNVTRKVLAEAMLTPRTQATHARRRWFRGGSPYVMGPRGTKRPVHCQSYCQAVQLVSVIARLATIVASEARRVRLFPVNDRRFRYDDVEYSSTR